ncbi:unnamed protein product [Caenorhabditis brenneri]
MVIGLTYLCQECLLQYLDPNRRIQLSARCPSIRKLDELVPLRIETLTIREKEITLNRIRFRVDDSFLEMKNQLGLKEFSIHITKNLPFNEMMNKLMGFFFNGRKNIKVHRFKAKCALESVVPEGLKFMTPNLIIDQNSITTAGQFIHEDSLPIQHLVLGDWPSTVDRFPFNVDIVRNAKFLEIIAAFQSEEDGWFQIISQLSNRQVSLAGFSFTYFTVALLIPSWREQLKDVGYKIIVDYGHANLERLPDELNSLLTGDVAENFGRERVYTAKHISIPLTRTSNVLINLLKAVGRSRIEILTVRHIPELVQDQE